MPADRAKAAAPATVAAGRKPAQPAPVTETAPPVATRSGGNVSLKVVPLRAWPALGLLMTKLSVLLLLAATAIGENDVTMVGRASRVAPAAAVLMTFWLLVNPPAGRVLV